MRTVVAFGGEHRELQKFSSALVQTRKGGVRNGFKVGAGMGYTMMAPLSGPFGAEKPGSSCHFTCDFSFVCGISWHFMADLEPFEPKIIFFGYALAFWFGMTLRYNGEINPATGKEWMPGNIMAIFFCVFIGSFMPPAHLLCYRSIEASI